MKSPLQKIEYDEAVDALYIYTTKGKIDKTVKLNERVLFDIDKTVFFCVLFEIPVESYICVYDFFILQKKVSLPVRCKKGTK